MVSFTYLIYCIFWLGLIFGGCGWAVFEKGASGWWFVLAFALGSVGLQPKTWMQLSACN